MRTPRVVACILVALVASGCSSNDGSHSSTRASAAPAASSGGGSVTASPSTEPTATPSSQPSGVGTKTSGPAHVGVVVNDGWQILPKALTVVDRTHLEVSGEVDDQGQFSAINPGTVLSVAHLSAPVTVAWMSADRVMKTDTWKACASSCPKVTAPAGSRYVVVQAVTGDDRIALTQDTGIALEMTKVNAEENMKPDRATGTEPPH